MRMAPAWLGAVGIGCGQRRPGLDLRHPEGELRHLGRGVGGENWLGTSGAASADRLGTGGMVQTGWGQGNGRCEIMTAVQVCHLVDG